MRNITTLLLCILLCLSLAACGDNNPTSSFGAVTEPQGENEENLVVESVEEVTIPLSHGLEVTKIGSYTGIYMEDGSDEMVSGVLMLAVKNSGKDYIQYAEITMGQACFSLSSLMPGETVVVLEQNRMAYQSGAEYAGLTAQNVARFSQAPTLCEDKLAIQTLDGCLNITNISGSDIAGDVVIYYKNYAGDLYYGGITYRVRLTGGMKANEIKQIMVNHFDAEGSKVVFVTVGE